MSSSSVPQNGTLSLYLCDKQEYGSIPVEASAMARRNYDYAVKAKLDRLAEMGINLTEIYKRINR